MDGELTIEVTDIPLEGDEATEVTVTEIEEEEPVLEAEEEFFPEKEDYTDNPSFRCLKEILLSRSSIFSHPLYFFPDLVDPGIDAAFNYVVPPPVVDDMGVDRYKDICKILNIVPLRRVLKSLATSELNLKFYGLSDLQFRAICHTMQINGFITNLDLQDNWVSVETANHLNEMLLNNKVITVLNLRECRIGPEGAELLSEGIHTSQTLEDLDLSYNSLTDEGFQKLKEALVVNTTIKKLNLGHNKLSENTALDFEEIMTYNEAIEDLNLEWNFLNTALGNKKFGKGLKSNHHLKSLNLAWNGLEDAAAVKPLTNFIRRSEILEFIDLSHNRIKEGALKAVTVALRRTRSLKHVKIGSNIYNAEEALVVVAMLANKPNSPIEILDMENVFFEKDVVPYVKKLANAKKELIMGGILSNYIIKGPDLKKTAFDRCRFLTMKPKKKKKKKDFGHIVLSLPVENPMLKADFEFFIKKTKKVKMLDLDVIACLQKLYFIKKGDKVDTQQLVVDYMQYWPDTKLPPPKPKKRKKGKKGKKNKEVIKATRDQGTQTEWSVSRVNMEEVVYRSRMSIQRKSLIPSTLVPTTSLDKLKTISRPEISQYTIKTKSHTLVSEGIQVNYEDALENLFV